MTEPASDEASEPASAKNANGHGKNRSKTPKKKNLSARSRVRTVRDVVLTDLRTIRDDILAMAHSPRVEGASEEEDGEEGAGDTALKDEILQLHTKIQTHIDDMGGGFQTHEDTERDIESKRRFWSMPWT